MPAPPVAVGTELELELEALVAGGEAIAHYEGYAVFVPGGAPGDRIRVRIVSARPQYARGEIVRLLSPGTPRVMPLCAVFGACGGCQWQHVAYEAQLAAKRTLVEEALRRIGRLEEVTVRPVLGAAEPWDYRNKVHWPIRRNPAGRVEVGLFAPRSHQVVDTEHCGIQHPLNNLVLAFLRADLNRRSWAIHDEATGKGWLRSAFVKVAHATDELMIGLVTSSAEFPDAAEWVADVRDRFPGVTSLVQNVNADPGNTLLGPRTRLLWGAETITEEVGGLSFAISANSFFQVNSRQVETLYGEVARQVGEPEGLLVDAYCGTGTIGLYLATRAPSLGRLVGMDEVPQAIADARENAGRNLGDRASIARFLAGRVEALLPELIEHEGTPGVVVLDPPRKGCEPEVLATLAAARIPRIVYVSCNPATLARDVAGLVHEHGYRLLDVQPVDMFPQTAHVETVATLVAR